jgi:putative ABC transport system substrate-binding protein
VRAFVHGLRDLGWIDGQTIVIERRSAEGKWTAVPAIFRDLVRSKVDVIVTLVGRGLARAAQQATRTIPIVVMGPSLVEQGLAPAGM